MLKSWYQYLVIKKSDLFDSDYYLISYPDVRRSDDDPLLHYIRFGWKESKNPSPRFNTRDYLEMNLDVKSAGVNPLYHYIKFGRKEGRLGMKPEADPLLSLSQPTKAFRPKVSIIVPNFNHSEFLERRLSSIYSQTYTNFDVILLDDYSTDNSRSILEKYQRANPKITRLYINSSNSGSAFSQWKKGILSADGELIWIAESDDYCDVDFLEKLVPFFYDETILLSYAHPIFVNEKGKKTDFAFENWLSDISRDKWNKSYVETAHNEVRSSLGLKNSIPNVSGAIFRRPRGELPILDDPYWLKMKVCGDWLFYLHLIRGGRIAFCKDTHNYYRIYQASSSKKTHVQDVYYQEHEKVACAVATLYNVSDDFLNKNHQLIKDFYFKTVKNGSMEKFSNLYNINKVKQSRLNRNPNVLMVTFAFAFGGGEIYPIRLANAYKEIGIGVTMFNCGFEPVHPEVRRMLYPLIPVINYNQTMDIVKILLEFGIDIIHTHHATAENLFASVRLNHVTNTKHVTTMHGMYEMMENNFKKNTKDIIKSVDKWLYTADKNIAPFNNLGIFDPVKFSKIDNGIKPPEIHQICIDDLGIGSDSFVACLASRALREKGWLESIDAVIQARKITGKDIHLLLIGEGEVYELLKKKTLPPFIHLLGYRPNVVDYLAASQVCLVPSYFPGESFPFVMIESFMAGTPVIASKIGEVPNMISLDGGKKGGILIDIRNGKTHPDDISSALVRMINDNSYYQECIAAANLLKARFDIEKIAAEYLREYKSLLTH